MCFPAAYLTPTPSLPAHCSRWPSGKRPERRRVCGAASVFHRSPPPRRRRAAMRSWVFSLRMNEDLCSSTSSRPSPFNKGNPRVGAPLHGEVGPGPDQVEMRLVSRPIVQEVSPAPSGTFLRTQLLAVQREVVASRTSRRLFLRSPNAGAAPPKLQLEFNLVTSTFKLVPCVNFHLCILNWSDWLEASPDSLQQQFTGVL